MDLFKMSNDSGFPETTSFEVNVSKDTFKFNAAHFVAYNGFRERLHGHNYKLSIRLLGSRKICSDGYVLDFGDVKAVTKTACKKLNEHFICPMYSDVITITDEANGENVKLLCQDGAEFSFPKGDCIMLPIVHSTVEEIAIYCWGEIILGLDAEVLVKRGVHTMEVTCSEATGQEAVFRMKIPNTNNHAEIMKAVDVRSFIRTGELFPKPCLPVANEKGAGCSICSHCGK
jgi:6-pyruvoyltetrahydropterin/6-carboxytetrahydropterin synthase